MSSNLGTEPSVARLISIHDSDRSNDSANVGWYAAKTFPWRPERVEAAVVGEQHREDLDALLQAGYLHLTGWCGAYTRGTR
jgi:hypothetical protein